MTSSQFVQGFLMAVLIGGVAFFIWRRFFRPSKPRKVQFHNREKLKEFFKSRIHTPMDEAVFAGDIERVLALARQGLPVRKLMLWELTSTAEPPHRVWASEALCRALIQAGADVKVRYLAGSKGLAGHQTFETPLSNALIAERLDLVRLFLESGADPNTPLDNGHPMRSRPRVVLDLVYRGETPFAREAKALLLAHGARHEPMGHYDGSRRFRYDPEA